MIPLAALAFLPSMFVAVVWAAIEPLLGDMQLRARGCADAARADGTALAPQGAVPLPPVPGTDPFGELYIVPRWVLERGEGR